MDASLRSLSSGYIREGCQKNPEPAQGLSGFPKSNPAIPLRPNLVNLRFRETPRLPLSPRCVLSAPARLYAPRVASTVPSVDGANAGEGSGARGQRGGGATGPE